MQHQVMRRQVLQHVAQVVHVRVDEERDLERGAGLVEMAVAQADVAEAGDGAEMARLEPQGLGDVDRLSASRFSIEASVARLFQASAQQGAVTR